MLSSRSLIFLILGSLLVFGCGTDESDLSDTRGYISSEKNKVYFHGDILILEGSFYNNQGLQQIEIINKELDLYYELNLHGQLVYDLNIEHTLPLLHSPEIHEVIINLTDVNNMVRTFSYMVDYAFHPKILNMLFSQDPTDPNKRYFQGRLEDPHGIKSLKLHSLRIGDLINLQFPDQVYTYDLNEDFWFPVVETFGEYPLTLQIVNQRGFNVTIFDFEEAIGN